MTYSADHVAQLRALVRAFRAQVDELREYHKHYMTVLGMWEAGDARREMLLQFLMDEREVLIACQRLQQQLDAYWQARREATVSRRKDS